MCGMMWMAFRRETGLMSRERYSTYILRVDPDTPILLEDSLEEET